MKFFLVFLISVLLISNLSKGQAVKLSCSEKERKSEELKDCILVKTCFLKSFKFVSISYPDYAGRYFYSEHEVYVRKNNQYIRITNSKVFNKNQDKLVATINERILQDFYTFSADSNTRECFTEIKSIPKYKMDDCEISFQGDDIWFEVHWGLSAACRSVDGTIVAFKVSEIVKYLN